MRVLQDAWRYLTDASSWTGDGGMLALLAEQLLLTAGALGIAVLVGLPLALWLGHVGRGGFLAINITNVGRAVPTFALLALLVTADPWGWTGDLFPGTATLGPLAMTSPAQAAPGSAVPETKPVGALELARAVAAPTAPTGLALSRDGRMFVFMPRLDAETRFSIGIP